jgi:hypothetical protein
MPVGTFLYGWLAALVDHETLLVSSAIVYAAVSLAALASPSVRNLRHRVDEADGSPAAAL